MTTEEHVIYNYNNMFVSDKRFMVGGKTYAIRNIVSTRGIEYSPGCLGIFFGKSRNYKLILTTSSGELTVYETTDSKVLNALLTALDKAIIS